MVNKELKYNPIGLSLQEELGPRRTAFLGTSASSTFFVLCSWEPGLSEWPQADSRRWL